MFAPLIGWLKGLSVAGKVAVGVVGFTAVGAVATPDTSPQTPVTTEPQVKSVEATQKPVVTREILTETEAIPFAKQTIETNSLNKGESRITTPGVDGVKTKTYTITKTDGVETNRVLAGEEVTTLAIDEVTSVGTYVAPPPTPRSPVGCDPNYAGACVPIASDVDCGGGSGNGPAYVYGTVQVIGNDVYGLDRNGDGYGCE